MESRGFEFFLHCFVKVSGVHLDLHSVYCLLIQTYNPSLWSYEVRNDRNCEAKRTTERQMVEKGSLINAR